MIKILIVDDHYLVGEGTKSMLETEDNMIVQYVSTGAEALELEEVIDLYIIDIHMPDMTGIELSNTLLQIDSDRKIILYTGFDNQASLELFTETGVSGIISKTATRNELVDLIYKVLAGYTTVPLTIFKDHKAANSTTVNKQALNERDLQILQHISDGFSTKEIASKLFLADRTVEYRLTQIYKKLAVKTRGEAVKKAIRMKLLKF